MAIQKTTITKNKKSKLFDLPVDLQDKLTELSNIVKKKGEIQTQALALLKSTLKQLLIDIPEIEAVRWNQYIPGFNDGEPCEFSINAMQIKMQSVSEKEMKEIENETGVADGFLSLDYDIDILQYDDLEKKYGKKLFKHIAKIQDTIYSLSDVLESEFGPNTEITVTSKGIEVDDYDCSF